MDLFENTPGNKVNLAEELKLKKAVIFAVPGAFTPGCSKVNLDFTRSFYLKVHDYLDRKRLNVEEQSCVSNCQLRREYDG